MEDDREAFYEGALMNMLFKKLQRLLDQVSCDKESFEMVVSSFPVLSNIQIAIIVDVRVYK